MTQPKMISDQELNHLEKEVSVDRVGFAYHQTVVSSIIARLRSAEEQLAFYADSTNWRTSSRYAKKRTIMLADCTAGAGVAIGGKRARAHFEAVTLRSLGNDKT
jgi:hypothetical protein